MPAEKVNLVANEDTRAGRMLAAGRVTLTVVSPKTGAHISIKLTAKFDNRDQVRGPKRWLSVPFAEATVVYVAVPRPDGWEDRVGAWNPGTKDFWADKNADPARVFAFREAVRYLAGEPTRCEVMEENRCGVCGRELTDPVSIQRGIGPECFGRSTGSKHQAKGEKS